MLDYIGTQAAGVVLSPLAVLPTLMLDVGGVAQELPLASFATMMSAISHE